MMESSDIQENERQKMRKTFYFLLGFLLICMSYVFAQTLDESLGKGWYAFGKNKTKTYLLERPVLVKNDKKYPLLLLLHGRDGHAESMVRLFKQEKKAKGWFLVAPQAGLIVRKGKSVSTWDRKRDAPYLMELLETLVDRYPIDEQRIAVVGYSAGAWMTIALVRKSPERFFRVGVVGGGRLGSKSGLQGFDHPEWYLLGGDRDRGFNERRIAPMVEGLKKIGAKVKWEVLSGVSHNSLYGKMDRVALWIFQ